MNKVMTPFLLATTLIFAGCNGNSDNASTKLTILVTNDDGIAAPGIARLVSELSSLKDVDVQVVAPAENKSGSSDMTTEGTVEWHASFTLYGYAGYAVDGFPADAVRVALNELNLKPDLVVSGVNFGQNVGPYAALSGTVGAARYAARAGIPAIASSAGLAGDRDFSDGAALVVAWIEENRDLIESNLARSDVVISFNVPSCTAGEIRGLVEVPLGTSIPSGVNIFSTNCAEEPDAMPVDDVDALIKGYSAQTEVPLEL